MGWTAKLQGVMTPGGGLVPTELLVHLAAHIPAVRGLVIAELVRTGHLESVGLQRVPWYVRMLGRRESPMPARE